MKTLLILPPGESGQFTISKQQWIENEYTPEEVGEAIRARAIELGIGMTMSTQDDAFGQIVVKWYPSGN